MVRFTVLTFLIFCFLPCVCHAGKEPHPGQLEGVYITYNNPHMDGQVEVVEENGKIRLSVRVDGTNGNTCQWEDETTLSQGPMRMYTSEGEDAAYVEINFNGDMLNITSTDRHMCGMGTYIDGTYVKTGSPAYIEAITPLWPLLPFENMLRGNVIAYMASDGRYTLVLDLVTDTFSIQGETDTRLFRQIEHVMKLAKVHDGGFVPEYPSVALLQNELENCHFLPILMNDIYISDFKLQNNQLLVDMCLDETDDCTVLHISKNNSGFEEMQAFLEENLHKTASATYSLDGEILNICSLE